eukprot:2683815-Rhodomonas_salina.10
MDAEELTVLPGNDFPAVGWKFAKVSVALVSVFACDDGGWEAEAPGLKESLVLENVAEHFAAVSKRECEVRAPGVLVGAE